MSRATLLVHYPTGQSYYEIDGVFYATRNLERLSFNRQSRDPFIAGPIRLAEVATITPTTRFQGAPFLVTARLPDFTAPDDPRNITGSVLLEASGPEVRVSPLTPRRADDWAFVGPLRNYIRLLIPDLTRDIAPGEEWYPQLPDQVASEGIWPVLARLRTTLHRARNWSHGEVPLPLADFNSVATNLLEHHEIDTPLRLQIPGISPADAPVLRQSIVNMGPHREANIVFMSRVTGLPQSDLRALFTQEVRQEDLRTQEETSEREISFERAAQMLTEGRITSSILDPLNQEGVRPGNTRVTLIGVDGREYDVEARYDSLRGQIFPPV